MNESHISGGRITAMVLGVLLALVSVGLLGGGGVALWADSTQRDAAGYLTNGVHEFSASGSALATERIDLGSTGTGWLCSPALLSTVRIRVTPVLPRPALFVGVGYPRTQDLATITSPVVCTYGSRSRGYMCSITRSLARTIPAARVREIDGAAHAVPFDAPGDFARVIAEAIHSSEVRSATRGTQSA